MGLFGTVEKCLLFLRRSDSPWKLVDLLDCSFWRIVPLDHKLAFFNSPIFLPTDDLRDEDKTEVYPKHLSHSPAHLRAAGMVACDQQGSEQASLLRRPEKQ